MQSSEVALMQEAKLRMIRIIQPIPILTLYFCEFHLMWEPVKGYRYARTLPRTA